MATTRRKSTPASAPQTLDEAITDLTRYVALDTELEKGALDAKEAVSKIKATWDAIAKPIEQEVKLLHQRLRTWWAVAGPELVDAGNKSAELAGVKIGLRMTSPRMLSAEKTDALAAALLVKEGLEDFVRVEVAPNKPAILAALADPQTLAEKALAARLSALGFRRDQREEFFLARPETLPPVETVEPLKEAA